jgi:hypothetical protein
LRKVGVKVFSLAKVEKLATDGGPCYVILIRAESLTHTCMMVSTLQAKGLLGSSKAGITMPSTCRAREGGDSDSEVGARVNEGSEGDADHNQGYSAGHGFNNLGAVGWVALHQQDPDLGDILEQVLSTDDVVTDGWRFQNL